MTDALIRADGIGAVQGSSPVLTDVSLAVWPGDVVALVGPNGAGKSTLLAVLAGDHPPTTGTVDLSGRPLGAISAAELARLRAVMPQHHRVAFPFSVGEVVAMGRAPWSDSTDDGDREAIEDAIRSTEIAGLVGRPVLQLSGGELARVAFARVLAQRTRVLLLDEPTAALDIHHQELVVDRIRRRAGTGAGVVVVVHDLGLAAALADRIVLLADGQVAESGPPAQVLRPDLLSEVYGHAIDVVDHPRTGEILVVPRRDRSPPIASAS